MQRQDTASSLLCPEHAGLGLTLLAARCVVAADFWVPASRCLDVALGKNIRAPLPLIPQDSREAAITDLGALLSL